MTLHTLLGMPSELEVEKVVREWPFRPALAPQHLQSALQWRSLSTPLFSLYRACVPCGSAATEPRRLRMRAWWASTRGAVSGLSVVCECVSPGYYIHIHTPYATLCRCVEHAPLRGCGFFQFSINYFRG